MIEIDPALFELFREEVRVHADTLSRGLVELESDPANPTRIEPLMRAAHSIKGASRIIGIGLGVQLAHVMEDVLVAAQEGKRSLGRADVDALLQGSDILATLAELKAETVADWENHHRVAIERLEPLLQGILSGAIPVPAPSATEEPEQPVADVPLLAADSPFPPEDFPVCPPFLDTPISSTPLVLPVDHSMFDVFREELRVHLWAMTPGLDADLDNLVENLKQIRGAARLFKCQPVERIANAVAQYLSAARHSHAALSANAGDWLRFTFSLLASAVQTNDESFPDWLSQSTPRLTELEELFERTRQAVRSVQSAPVKADVVVKPVSLEPGPEPKKAETPPKSAATTNRDGVVRVTAQSLNRLMGLAGESLVQARWLPSFSTALLALKRHHDLLATLLERAVHACSDGAAIAQLALLIADARRQAALCRSDLASKSVNFDDHAARAEDLNGRLYREVILSRMRPFGDGVHGMARLVRDMARTLGKDARLAIEGERTEVDRDILEKLESPLAHLVRNSIDHGLEEPAARAKTNKPATGTIRIEARHRAGMLHVTVGDDGAGIDLDKLRGKIVERGLNTAEIVRLMNEAELLEFLFLPGFSTASNVTEFSGRGVGLDVVQHTLRKVGGSARVSTVRGQGTTFHLQLPLTLSVIRAVVVDVAGEPYAFPHTRIDRLLRVPRSEVMSLEHRQFAIVDGRNVGLVVTAQLLDLPPSPMKSADLAVVLLSDSTGTYGLVVDAFRGEQDLVVRPLDPRLGKVPNLSAAAILDDGSPVLIVDVEDIIRSTDQFIQTGALKRCETHAFGKARKKRVLVVEDSITVREVERQLLMHHGYEVAVAVDGMEGWNKVRAETFDLLVSDIDMPRMGGLELVAAVRNNEKLKNLPVVIVSYKERDDDRLRGLEVGANCYLTKSSFHDNRFIEAVEDLIGSA